MYNNYYKKLLSFLKEERQFLKLDNKIIFNNFSVCKYNEFYKINIINKMLVLKVISENKKDFIKLPFYKDVLNLIKEDIIIVKNINDVINICYFDAILFNILDEKDKNLFINTNIINIIKNSKKNKKAKLFEVNKSSLYFDKSTSIKRYKDIVDLGFNFVEIDPSISFLRFKELIKQMILLTEEKNIQNFNVSLRIKKLGHYKSKGFYSKESNTIFIDPRYLKVWRHELGHYFVENMKIQTDHEEVYADNF